jgi:fibronectin type 3 domain-containing protein
VLTWDGQRGATKYRIRRTDYSAADLRLIAPPTLPDGFKPDLPPTPAGPGDGRGKHARLWLEGQSVALGTTTNDYFVDRDSETGARYMYEVFAEDGSGADSQPSNLVTVEAGNPDSTKHVDDQLKTERRGRLPKECR